MINGLIDLNVGWMSNARHAPTGYGGQTDLFAPRIQRLLAPGRRLMISAWYGLQGTPQEDADGILTLPSTKQEYSNDMMAADAERWGWDIVITLVDAWVINPNQAALVKWCPWFPIDCDPIPPGVLDVLRAAYRPMVYSKSAKRLMDEAGIACEYIPHGIDTNVFKPLGKKEARASLNCDPDKFLIGIVAANKGSPSRKSFDQQIRAYAEFYKTHPNSLLYIHTDWFGGFGGEDIRRIIQLAGLPPDAVAEPPAYEFLRGMLGNDYLIKAYSAFDVLLSATRGEGFCIPVIEAMACGTPAIVTDATALPELIDAGAGWKVPYSDKFFYQNSYQFVPSVPGIVSALESAYENRDNTFLGEQARAGVVANYDADYVTETYWKPVLAKLEDEISALKAKKAERAQKRADLRLVKPEEPTTNGVEHSEPVATPGAAV